MANLDDYKLPGEFVHDGMIWNSQTSAEVLERVKTYPFKKNDIVLSSYPKSGTTWMQEILWRIVNNGVDSDLDLQQRAPYLEISVPEMNVMEVLEQIQPGDKLVKTHLPASYYTKQIESNTVKIVVIMRNIRDNLVSFYHHYRMNGLFGYYPGTFDQFFTLFQKKKLFNGDWLDFNLSWWENRKRDNIHIVFFEDLKENPMDEIKKLARFCGKKLSADVIFDIVQKTSFQHMSQNSATNYTNYKQYLDQSISKFMRKGQVGDWKNYLSKEQLAFIAENYEPQMKAAELNMRYEI